MGVDGIGTGHCLGKGIIGVASVSRRSGVVPGAFDPVFVRFVYACCRGGKGDVCAGGQVVAAFIDYK